MPVGPGLNDTLYRAWKLRGDIRQRLQDPDGALDDYGRAMKLRDDDARLFVSRGAARITMGNIKGAMKDLDRAGTGPGRSGHLVQPRLCQLHGPGRGPCHEGCPAGAQAAPEFPEALFLSGVVKGTLPRGGRHRGGSRRPCACGRTSPAAP